jgi:[ribosomal protein S18]-alanine N-acetyltransferase
MSAQLQFGPRPPQREPMTLADLEAVLAIEQLAYAFPWTRGNFIDSLAAGYCVAMNGVDEMHLLNLTVAPDCQHRGLARGLLDALVADSRAAGAAWLWLEVRESNQRAREVYRRYGFAQAGWRRAYYPASAGQREDACVMRLALNGDTDALE